MSTRGFEQRPTTPRIRTSGCLRSFARGCGHDDGIGVVCLHAAVEQMQWLADHAAVDDILHREALLVVGFGIVRGVMAVDNADMSDLLGGGAEVVHVAHEGRRERLSRALPAIGAAVQRVARDGSCGADAGATNPHLRESVHRTENHHGVAHAGLDDADRDADQRFGR